MTVGSVDGAGFSTRQLHAGESFDAAHSPRITPIYLTAGFLFDDFDQAQNRFSGEDPGFVYSRGANPTNHVAEARLASLDGGVGAVLVASGQAAVLIAVLSVARAGDHVLVGASIYEGSRGLFRNELSALGIEFEFVDDHNDLDDWARRVRPSTKAFFAETIPNPKNEVLDVQAVADLAHSVGVPLIVDNTLPTPYLLRPIEHGADIVVYSTSKLLTGHGASIGGAIVDGGNFDWAAHADRFPQFSGPFRGVAGRPTYIEKFGRAAFTAIARGTAGSFGPTISPLHAFLLLQGLDTLSLRLDRHSRNALAIAEHLAAQPEVESVDYPGLPESPHHALAERYLPRGAGAVFAFTLHGGAEAVRTFYDSVELFSRMTHIGDARSYILHPPTTTHSRLTAEERRKAGIGDGLIRLSIGLEDVEDLIADLDRGFQTLRGIDASAEPARESAAILSGV